jgi:hypothetical protein
MSREIQSPPLDPALLAAFRQEASVIVAHERGLTATCRLKLAGIARKLGISDDQVEQAIRSLAAIEPSAPPNRQAERFRRRLRKDLSGKRRTIIGPTIEAQILAAAHRKYALDDVSAGQVIAEVTAELGLTRISASDAIQSLAAQIDQAAGNSSWLAREAWDRLRSAGAKWGLELEVIDELIDERLAANRSAYLRSSTSTKATLNITIAAVIVAGAIIGFLFLARSARENAASTEITSQPVIVPPNYKRPTTPTWWDVDLSVDMAHAKSQLKELTGSLDLISSIDASQRAAGYEQLLEQVRSGVNRQRIQPIALTLVASCLALEADEDAALRLQSALLNLLPSTASPLPSADSPWNAAFWAADTAAAGLARRGATPARKTAIADVLASLFGETIDASIPQRDQQQRLRQLTALAAYRQLTAAASKQPADIARLYPSLSQRAATLLTDEDYLRSETALLAAAAPASGGDWKLYERPLARCISSPDPLPALRLVDALRRANDKNLVDYLSRLLLVRAGARPKSQSKADIIAAVRRSLSGNAALTAADRWISLQDDAGTLLEKSPATDDRELITEYISLVHLTTLAIALAQGEAGIATFDAGLAHPPSLAAQSSSESSRGDLRLDELQQLIADSYRQRAALLNAAVPAAAGARAPEEALELCISALAGGKNEDSFIADLPHQQTALHYLAGDSLRYTVGLQRLLIELSARRAAKRRPERAAAARQIAGEALTASASAKSILIQMREQEAALLRLWMLYATDA